MQSVSSDRESSERPSRAAAPSLRGDVIGGLTTFVTMAYIVVVNPAILSTQGTGMAFSGVLTATVLLSFAMTLLMGVYAKIPFAVAPGMGINAFFTFTIVLGQHVPWQSALGVTFWAGVAFLIVSLTPLREWIAQAIPIALKHAAAAGIGLFLAFIGLKNSGLVVADPVTFVKPGPLDARALLAVGGLVITAALIHRKNPFAYIAGIASVSAAALVFGLVPRPRALLSAPDFHSVMFRLDPIGALRPSLVAPALAILFTDLFDSLSTFIGVAHATGLVDEEGHPRNLRRGLLVDSLATLGAGLLGTSSGTAFIESAAGIEAGAKTGRASIVTAMCFLPCMFIAPVAGLVPPYATGPVLVLVGASMFRTIARSDLARVEDAIPAFLTVALIPLTFSITQGMLWGFLAHVLLYVLAGRSREIKPGMYAIAACSVLLLYLERHGH